MMLWDKIQTQVCLTLKLKFLLKTRYPSIHFQVNNSNFLSLQMLKYPIFIPIRKYNKYINYKKYFEID